VAALLLELAQACLPLFPLHTQSIQKLFDLGLLVWIVAVKLHLLLTDLFVLAQQQLEVLRDAILAVLYTIQR